MKGIYECKIFFYHITFIYHHRHCRDCQLLSWLSDTQTAQTALAHCAYDHHACPVRMVIDPSSHRDRASVCRIRWHIYRDGFGMAKICRWRFSDTLGQHWRFGDTVGRNYHYPATQKFVITLCNQQIC